jgi:hypothetical protein
MSHHSCSKCGASSSIAQHADCHLMLYLNKVVPEGAVNPSGQTLRDRFLQHHVFQSRRIRHQLPLLHRWSCRRSCRRRCWLLFRLLSWWDRLGTTLQTDHVTSPCIQSKTLAPAPTDLRIEDWAKVDRVVGCRDPTVEVVADDVVPGQKSTVFISLFTVSFRGLDEGHEAVPVEAN